MPPINGTQIKVASTYGHLLVVADDFYLVLYDSTSPVWGLNRWPQEGTFRVWLKHAFPAQVAGVGFGRSPPGVSFTKMSYGRVPMPYIAAASAGIAGWAGWKWRGARGTARRLAGRCPACGYDLRASPKRCPECGRDVESGEPVPRPTNPETPVTKKILDVGQCAMDGPALKKLLQSRLDASVTDAATGDAADRKLAEGDFDLILVNRVFDKDDASGLDWIEHYKQAGGTAPVMLVSDKDDAQASAEKLGAARGFGKSTMKDQSTLDLIRDTMGGE